MPGLWSSLSHQCPCLTTDAIPRASLREPAQFSLPAQREGQRECGDRAARAPGFIQNYKTTTCAWQSLELSRASLPALGGSSWPWARCFTPQASRSCRWVKRSFLQCSPSSHKQKPIYVLSAIKEAWRGAVYSRVIKTQNTLQARCGLQPTQASSSSQRPWGFFVLFCFGK